MLSRPAKNGFFAAALLVSVAGTASRARAQTAVVAAGARRSEGRVSVTWQGQQLGAGLARLAELQQVAIWIDRRVDPSTSVDASASNQPLLDVLRGLGEPHGWSATAFNGIAYFGPKQTADELATLAALARQQVAKAPTSTRNAWLKSDAWSFPRLSQPRELLGGLAKSAVASISGAELVPLDLWPARSLPPMPVVDRVILLLSGFDLTCEISADGRRLNIVPIKRPVQIRREYSVPAARTADVNRVLTAMPAAKTERHGQRMTVFASIEEHEQLTAALRGRPQPANHAKPPSTDHPATQLSNQRFTLRIENKPVGAVIDHLAKQLDLEVTWDPALQAGPKTRRDAFVSCEVREANIDGLLKAILSPAKLAFQRDGRRVAIRDAKP
jgi:hypothetical protein